MGAVTVGPAALAESAAWGPPHRLSADSDRFIHWPRLAARPGLIALLMLLLAFAIVPLERPDGEWPNVTTRFNGKPMLTAGLAFAPRAIASLLASARAKSIAR